SHGENVMRLVAVQHLRAAYGIKTKNWNKNKTTNCKTTSSSVSEKKVFGVALESLPSCNMECGSVPSFLVKACMCLMAHVNTEGLFRKSGSVVRLKALKAKVDAGEDCLSSALPCDVAGLVKQFFRELPEPVLPTELQEAFIKAQQLPTQEERTAATMLLSCVLPERNVTTLHHFFHFLHHVSKRSVENKMDSSNLAVILAPNLLHFGDGTEKMNANTEKRIKLQTTVVHCFIENASRFGVLPRFLQDKVPAMLGCESGALSPNQDELEEEGLSSGMKRRNRRSFGDVVSGALNKMKTNRTPTNAPGADALVFSSGTPVGGTPSSKRKLPLESAHSFGFSNKKRRSVKKNLGVELLPNTLFSGTLTPSSAYSASGVLESSQSISSPAGRSRRQPATSARRKSRRLSSHHAISRVESGKTGCFSPKVTKKEAPLKSLRLRFSLGKSSKDAAADKKGSESIGLRLATQESTASFPCAKETGFSPALLQGNVDAKGSKFISRSEDNLLTPRCAPSAPQVSWSARTPIGTQVFGAECFSDTPMKMCLKGAYASEPTVAVAEPPAAAGLPAVLCCASSAVSLESQNSGTDVQNRASPAPIKKSESGCDLQAADPCSSAGVNTAEPSERVPRPAPEDKGPSADAGTPGFLAQHRCLSSDLNITFDQAELVALTPLHIDSVVFEPGAYSGPPGETENGSFCAVPARNLSMEGENDEEAEQRGAAAGAEPPKNDGHPEVAAGVPSQQSQAASVPERERRRVADHIHHFNKLTLHSPKASGLAQVRSPLKFQRTPVRQAVRRINSLSREGRRCPQPPRQVVKALSLESGLLPLPQLPLIHSVEPEEVASEAFAIKRPPPVPPRRPSTRSQKLKAGALGDVTNKIQPKSRADDSVCSPAAAAQKPAMQLVEKDMSHYRGSPRNPLNQGRLLSATRPVDL
uniref:Rho GTPase activating protein 11A n=1 Tax=Tetraodon nigroviridis TaxID=99883 RepID=H3DJ94_TETNG